MLPAAADSGLGVLAFSPLGRGLLSGKYRDGIPADSRGASANRAAFVQPYLDQRCARIVDAVSMAAEGLGVLPVAVALAWVRDRPGIVCPVIGARTLTQLAGSLGSEQLTLPQDVRAALDEVSAPR